MLENPELKLRDGEDGDLDYDAEHYQQYYAGVDGEVNAVPPVDEITDADVVAVTLAALLHDVGHPAFSHLFEKFMQSHPAVRKIAKTSETGVEWTHEKASELLIEKLLFDTSLSSATARRKRNSKDETGEGLSLHQHLIASVPGWSAQD